MVRNCISVWRKFLYFAHSVRATTLCLVFGFLLATDGVRAGEEAPQWTEVHLSAGQFSKAAPASWVQLQGELPPKMQAPVYFRLFDTQYRFAAQTGSDRYVRLVVDGNQGAQVQQQCKQSLTFDPTYQTLVLHTVGLWRDGRLIDQLAKAQPRFLTSDKGQSSVYTGQVNVLLEIPDCRAGDAIDLAWTVGGRNPVFGSYNFAVEQMGVQDLPISSRRVSFMSPRDEPLHVDAVPQADGGKSRFKKFATAQDTVSGPWRRVQWHDAAVPAQRIEAFGAQGDTQLDMVTASTFADWSAVERWAADLFVAPKAPRSAAYQSLVRDIKQRPTEAERVARALQWVQREIRYVSVSLGESAYRPASPDVVLERRYGDCKDVTLLLTTVLREAGVDVQPALMTSFNGRIASRLNAVPWFDHAVAVAWVTGRPYVLDATLPEQPSRLERMAVWHALKEVFVPAGPHKGFVQVPVAPDVANRTQTHAEVMELQPDGKSGVLSIHITLSGSAAEQQRQLMRSVPLEQVKEQVLNDLRHLYPNATWKAAPSYTDQAQDNRIDMHAQFVVPEVLKRRFGVGQRYEFSDNPITQQLAAITDAKRALPVGLPSELVRVVFSHELRLPAGWRVDEGLYDEAIQGQAFVARATRTRPTPHSLLHRVELEVKSDRVAPEHMRQYHDAVRQVLDLETTLVVKQP